MPCASFWMSNLIDWNKDLIPINRVNHSIHIPWDSKSFQLLFAPNHISSISISLKDHYWYIFLFKKLYQLRFVDSLLAVIKFINVTKFVSI